MECERCYEEKRRGLKTGELCEMLTVADVRWECSCKSLYEFIYLFMQGWNTLSDNY